MPEETPQQQKQDANRIRQAAAEQFAPMPAAAGLPWRLMLSTLFLLLFAVFVYIGLKFGYNAYVDNQLADTEQGMDELASKVTESQQEELLIFYSQLVNLENVLQGRQFSRNIFTFLEQNTLPLVYYAEAKYDAPSGEVSLTGTAATMEAFVEQTSLFQQSSDVARVSVEDVNLSGGSVTFNVRVALKGTFFKHIE